MRVLRDCVRGAEIVSGARPHELIDQGPHWIAILDIAPVMPGHTLLMPRAHVKHIWDVSPDLASALGAALQRVAERLESRLRPAGLTVFQTNRAHGWQSVPHVHFHLIPRETGDPLLPPWTPSHEQPRQSRSLVRNLLTE